MNKQKIVFHFTLLLISYQMIDQLLPSFEVFVRNLNMLFNRIHTVHRLLCSSQYAVHRILCSSHTMFIAYYVHRLPCSSQTLLLESINGVDKK